MSTMVVEGPVVDGVQVGASDDLAQTTVCLQLRTSQLGIVRKANVGEVQTDAERRMLRLQKELIDKEALKPIRRHLTAAKEFVLLRSLPSVMLRGGIYRIPVLLVAEVDSRLKEFRTALAPLVQAFGDEYAKVGGLRDKGLAALHSLGRADEYPSRSEVEQAFGLDWSFFAWATPASLESVDLALYEEQLAKAQVAVQAEVCEATALFRAELLGLVAHMHRQLTPGEDGKPRKFYSTWTNQLSEFISVFPFRNVVADEATAAVVENIRTILRDGIDPKALKDSASLRAGLAAQFASVKGRMETLAAEMPVRMIRLGGDE